jgi:hypothetical protein
VGSPRRSRAVWLTASSLAAASLLAGCGGGEPKLAAADAAGLIALTHRIAREGTCAQARDIPLLQHRSIALVNAGRVPSALQEPLLSGVAALAAQTPVCLAKVTASSPGTTGQEQQQPSRPTPPAKGKGHRHDDHGHGRGHGKKR